MIQGLSLQQPAVRRYFGIAPLYKPNKTEGPAKNEAFALFESMLPKPAKVQSATAGAEAGKNGAAYMRPSYQAPNIHTNGPLGPKNNVIDVVAKSRSTSSTSPDPQQEKSGGIMGRYNSMRDGYKNMKNFVLERGAGQKERKEALAKKERAAAYERKAIQRQRQGQGQGGKGGR